MGLSVGGNWWDQLGTSIGDSLIGMADPFGSLNPGDPMARQNAIRQTVGSMGAGMLANSRKRPMEAFGSAFQGAQQQGQQNSMNMLNAQNLMLGMEKTKKDMAWQGTERQNALEDRDAEEDRKKQMAEYVQQQLANPDIPQNNKANAMFFMAAGDYEKAYQALQPAQPDYMAVGEGASVFDKQSGKFTAAPQIPGGFGGKPTDDMREYQMAKEQGFEGSFMDFMRETKKPLVSIDNTTKLPAGYMWVDKNDPEKGVKPIAGGPGEQIPGELAARIGLADSFLGQVDEIRQAVAAGEATGPFDAVMGYMGVGKAGEARRKIDSGADALQRMLTGAGMPAAEAAEYARRYKPQMQDTAEVVLDKLAQLERELQSAKAMAMKGRGGAGGTPQTQPQRYKFNPETGELE